MKRPTAIGAAALLPQPMTSEEVRELVFRAQGGVERARRIRQARAVVVARENRIAQLPITSLARVGAHLIALTGVSSVRAAATLRQLFHVCVTGGGVDKAFRKIYPDRERWARRRARAGK